MRLSRLGFLVLLVACSPQNSDVKPAEALGEIRTPRILIEDGAEFTHELDVTITVQSPDTKWMMLSNEVACERGSDWFPQADRVSWFLSDGNARSFVYAKFRSPNGTETDCVSASIIHDNKNPLVDISERPDFLHPIPISKFSFEGHDEESGLDFFECQLRYGSFLPCAPNVIYSGLPDGLHTLLVRAVDRAGNRSDAVSAEWLIDTTPPVVSIEKGPSTLNHQSGAIFEFRGSDRGGSGIETIACQVGPVLLTNCQSPFFVPTLADGNYLFKTWATDRAGHTSAQTFYAWSIDNVPADDFSILGVDTFPKDNRLDSWLNGESPTLHWTDSSGSTQYRVWILSPTDEPICMEVSTTRISHTFDNTCTLNDSIEYKARVLAMDGVGNTRLKTYDFTVDRTPPSIQIQAPRLTGDQKHATISFEVSDRSPGRLASVTCQKMFFEGGQSRESWQECEGQLEETFDNLDVGQHRFKIVATDLAGNISEKEVRWTVENVVCDPFSGDTMSCRGGLLGEIYHLTQEQRVRFLASAEKSIEFFFLDGNRLPATLSISKLFVGTRRFNLGFPTVDGNLLKDDQGHTLVDHFALKLRSVLRLDTDHPNADQRDEVGYYQLAILSDDGSMLDIQPDPNGPFETLVDNDGAHSTRLGCATSVVDMKAETRLPIRLNYYQGAPGYLALTVMWRKVASALHTDDPLCGQQGDSLYFGPYPHSDFSSSHGFGQLLERGWKVLGERNYVAP